MLLAGFEPSRQVERSEIPTQFRRGSNPAPAMRDYTSIYDDMSVCIGRTTKIKDGEGQAVANSPFL